MATKRVRAKKFFITAINERFPDNLQFNVLTLLNDDSNLLINQYAKTFTIKDLGEFDITRQDNFGILSFFPIDNRPNDYTYAFSSFNFLQGNATEEFESQFLGDLASISSFSTKKSLDFSKIIELPFDFSSSKLEIQLTFGNNYQFDEISFTHNANNSGIGETSLSSVNYGTIFSGPLIENSAIGFGTYFTYIENDKVFIDFIPSIEIEDDDEIDFNISLVSIANTNFSVEGIKNIRNVSLVSKKTFIPKTQDPNEISATVVGLHGFQYQASYYVAQCTDLINNQTQISEIVVINSRTQSYLIEYGVLFTKDRIGSFSSLKTLDTELFFTPIENSDIEVTLFQVKISSFVEFPDSDILDLDNFELESGLSRSGIDGDFVLDFNLSHKQIPIFERLFNGSNSTIVNLTENTIFLPNHFFTTGEKVKYISDEEDESNNFNSIGIAITEVPGIGVTNKLPSDVYVIKVDNTRVKLAKTAEDALKILPESFNFTNLGTENVHKIVATEQNSKALISIDNIIQSPIRFTGTETILSENIDIEDFSIIVNDEKLFAFNNLIKINDEIMRISSVGIGTTNSLIVRRNVLGTNSQEHIAGSLVQKIKGNYNISNNRLYFTSPPYGLTPTSTESDPFDEKDYFGLQSKSSFDGRVFLRSGIPLSVEKSYIGNHVFNDLTEQFDGIESEFLLEENKNSITGISENNAIILLNNVYQSPKGTTLSNVEGYYELTENLEETRIKFIGQSIQNLSDINTSRIPYGGVIVSVGSTDGFGYQSLVSAGGTAIVSAAGTISQISIGNSGSGYRDGLQSQINVGVKTYSSGTPNIEIVGIASVMDGNIVGVNITNPGFGYTFTNPPEVVFDAPLGYVNIPLIYSNQSQSGIGTQATIDIVVGKGNNVIDFNINNFGYGYKVGDILTVPIDTNIGIPTISGNNLFSEFQIFVDETYNVDFSGWSMGQFDVLDNLDSKFNGRNKNFQISFEGKPISISKRKGSPIELEYVLLVFINDILQIPFKNYTFNGSIIRFNSILRGPSTNPPFKGDTSKIIFYKGTQDIDVNFVEILDAPKIGDLLTIKSDNKQLSQKSRIIESISSIDTADTNKYSDSGISEDENLLRPVIWCKQTEDLYISGREITKDRKIYNPYINPISYLIKDLEPTDSEIFVDSAKLFFDYAKENISEKESSTIQVISNTENIGEFETITNVQDIQGDFGIIVGIGSTSILGVANKCLTFDLFVPKDSYLRDTELNSGISTEGLSGIQTSYRFVVSSTNNGAPNISFDEQGNIVSIGNTFLDNIYECLDFNHEPTFLAGIGFTTITRVLTYINNYDDIEFINPLGFIEDFNFVGGTEIISAANNTYNIMPIDGSGLNASFNVQRNSIGEISSISSNDGGFGYNIGDQLSIPGDLIGGGGQIDDISFTGTSVDYSEEYFGVGGTTSGSGVDAEFDIERDSFGEITSVEVINKGSSYSKNEIITILGSDVGGINNIDDIVITVENTEIKSIDFIGTSVNFGKIYTELLGTTSGSGVDAEFDIERDQFGEISFVDIVNKGSFYSKNDIITILGSDVGGVDSDDDIIITVENTEIKSIDFIGTDVGAEGFYIGVGGTTSGNGFGAEFTVERNEFGEIISLQITNMGTDYEIGDTITILGSDVDGDDIDDDIVITVTDTQIKNISFVASIVEPIKIYLNTTGTTSGNGFGAVFDVERNEFGEIISFILVNIGTDYEIDDTVTILGSDVGGNDIDDDIIVTVTDTQIKNISFVASIVEPIKVYLNTTGTTSGSGLDAEFNVERNEFGEIISVDISNQGLRYEINDTITILGSEVGGEDIIDDIIITVEDITDLDFVLINVSDISIPDKFIFGKYSWAKIVTPFRSSTQSFNKNLEISKIKENPVIRRKRQLKTDLYLS